MRRPENKQERMVFRAKATSTIRRYLTITAFDVETPILTRATPEGARDYLAFSYCPVTFLPYPNRHSYLNSC